MKKSKLLLILPAALALSSCSLGDLFNKISGKDPEQGEQQGGEQGGEKDPEKVVTDVQLVEDQTFSVVQNGTLDPSTIKVRVYYNDRTNEEKVADRVEVDTSVVGQANGKAYYGEWEVDIVVTVISETDVVHVTAISVDSYYPILKVGEEKQINVTFTPENATNKGLVYESADPTKVTVSSAGVLKGIAVTTSQVDVTVTSADNSQLVKTLKVTVNPVAVGLPSQTVAGYNKFVAGDTLKHGEIVNLAGAIGEDAYYMPIYSTGNNIKAVATTVENDKISIPEAANFTVVKNSDGLYSFLDANGKYLCAAGSSDNNYLKVEDEITDISKFALESDGEYVVLKAKGKDRGYICLNPDKTYGPMFSCYGKDKVTSYDRVYMYHNGIEVSGEVKVTGVSFKDASYQVEVGKTVNVEAMVAPSLATNKAISYSIKDANPVGCATVDGNVVTGVAAGEAKVVATSDDGGFQAEVPLTVVAPLNYGTAEAPITVSQAMAIIEAQCTASGKYTAEQIYCEGKVSVQGTSKDYGYQNTKVTDGSKEVLIYSLNLTAEQKANYKVNSTVKFHGYATNYGGTLEFTSKGTDYVTADSVTAPVVAVTGVSLDATSAELTVGATKTLAATVLPEDASNKNVSWSSSAEAVATVANGVVTAVGVGDATITAKTEDGNFEATCAIHVAAGSVAVTGVSLDATSASLLHIPGSPATKTLVATLIPESPTNSNVTWSSDNEAVATVANGVVTTVGAGTANIKVTTEDGGFEATCAVTVTATDHAGTEADPFTGADAMKVYGTLELGEVSSVSYYIKDVVTSKTGTFSSIYGNLTFNFGDFVCFRLKKENNVSFTAESDLEVGDTVVVYAKIQNYNDSTKGSMAETSGGYVVSVTKPTFAVTGVSLDKTSGEIAVGSTLNLVATVAPANATNPAVTWTSDNEAVATVVNGVVTAVAAGTANIKVTTADGGFEATCVVTVVEGTIAVTGVTLDCNTADLLVGGNKTLVATVAPEGATNKAVTWTSDNEAVATVANGVVTAVAAGTANIKVTTTDGNFEATCVVTVTDPEITVDKEVVLTKAGLGVGTSYGDKTTGDYQWTQLTSQTVTGGAVIQGNSSKSSVLFNSIKFSKDIKYVTVVINSAKLANATNTAEFTFGNQKNPTDNKVAIGKDTDYSLSTAGSFTFIPTASRYFQLSFTNGAVYIESITIGFEEYKAPSVESVSLNKSSETLNIDGTLQLTATVLPANAENKNISWESSDTSVATVSATGLVTAVAAGSATITVTTEDGSKTATCAITVQAPVQAKTYSLVKSADDLVDGQKYVIVGKNSSAYYSMGNYADGNNCAAVATTLTSVTGGVNLTLASGSVAEITLGGETGAWTLKDENGKFLYAAGGSSKNYLKGYDTVDDKGQFGITVSSDGVITAKCNNSATTKNWLRFNPSSSCFACYASGQNDVYFYKLVG